MLTRRSFLASAAAGAALSIAAPAFAETVPADTARLLARAKAELERLGAAIPNHDLVAVADYAAASKSPRFHILDIAGGTVSSLLVAHGRGSDPGNSGWVKAFSNAFGSNASSEGAFKTAEFYSGKHGRSMRLDGLDPGNSNARDRAIVIHSAWYVNPAMALAAGRIGRSEGCFAFSDADLPKVLDRLGPGRLLLSTKL
ncbi:MAG: murein L,D-transpeptidase catalytic domain family protein [Caulobacteraceae bacterium]|nr:MAG: murein L,D-transpeptidase catalytic domain family protein [Caulobacteraceae bacterium]